MHRALTCMPLSLLWTGFEKWFSEAEIGAEKWLKLKVVGFDVPFLRQKTLNVFVENRHTIWHRMTIIV